MYQCFRKPGPWYYGSYVKRNQTLIHNFVGAKEVYPEKYVWSSLNDIVNMLSDEEYSSIEYRNFIEKNYSISDTNHKIISEIIEGKDTKTQQNQ